MFFKLSFNTAFVQTHTEGSVRAVHYVLSVLITDYKFKQHKLAFIVVVKVCCELKLHFKSEILISLSRKMSFVKKKTGDKVP